MVPAGVLLERRRTQRIDRPRDGAHRLARTAAGGRLPRLPAPGGRRTGDAASAVPLSRAVRGHGQREKPTAESSGSGRCAGARPGSSGGSSWVGAGDLPGQSQPSQKQFETRLWWALRRLDPARPVYVESESRRIGDCQLPDALLGAIRQSACVALDVPVAQRIRLLRDEYRHYERYPERLCARLDCLAALHGLAAVERWKAMVRNDSWDALVACLLQEHYDPVYRRSIQSNYLRAGEAVCVSIPSADASEFERAARQLALGD